MVTISGEYQGELHCVATHDSSGNTLTTDAPKDNQGRGAAFSPTDLLATGYATCIITIMAITARKRGVELNGLRFTVSKEMASDTPRRISKLTVHLWLPAVAKQLPEGYLENAARTCPAHHSLSPSIEKVVEFHWQ